MTEKTARLLILAALTFTSASMATAQDAGFRVESLNVGAGQNATTSGLATILALSNANGGRVEVWAMQDMAMFLAGRSFKVGRATILTTGFVTVLEEALAFGPQIGISVPIAELAGQQVSLTFLEWPGVFPARAPKSYLDHDLDNPKLTWLQMAQVNIGGLAARGESPSAFDERSILVAYVAPPSNTGGILGRRALSARRLARLGATPDFHHGLLGLSYSNLSDLDEPTTFPEPRIRNRCGKTLA